MLHKSVVCNGWLAAGVVACCFYTVVCSVSSSVTTMHHVCRVNLYLSISGVLQPSLLLSMDWSSPSDFHLRVSGVTPGMPTSLTSGVLLENNMHPAVHALTCMQARSAPQLVSRSDVVSLAPEVDAELINSPEARRTFEAGDGGVLAVSATATNGVILDGNGYTVYTNVPFSGDGGDTIASLCGLNPTARGSVRARSTDPRDSVWLDTNFLGNEVDVANGLRCLQTLQDVHDELTPVLGLEPVLPGPESNGRITRDFLTREATFFHHFVASCALGEVVDEDFKVMGVDGLRVVDASVQPELPPFAGPAATVYMLAELASETIVAAHQ